MKRIQKLLKKELDDNEEAIESMMELYNSTCASIAKQYEKDISQADSDIQKHLTGIANKDPEDVLSNIYEAMMEKEAATKAIETIGKIHAFLFEEIVERKVVKGLKNNK